MDNKHQTNVKIIRLLFFILFGLIAFTLYQTRTATAATSISLNETSIALNLNQEYSLVIQGTINNAVWSTDNNKIAIVSKEGVVTANGIGNCHIYAKVGSKKYPCKVIVEKSSIRIDNSYTSLQLGETAKLKLLGTIKSAVWTSSSSKVAKINSKTGKITAVSKGSTTITAKLDGKNYTQKIKVTQIIADYELSEWNMALASGIIPDGMPYYGNITPTELIKLLCNTIQIADGNTAKFMGKLSDTYAHKNTVLRNDTAFALAYAAQAMGIDTRYTNGVSASYIADGGLDGNNYYSCSLFNVDVWGTTTVTQGDYTEAVTTAYWPSNFCIYQGSLVSHNSLMPTDSNMNFNFLTPTKRKDAILGAWRLYTSLPKEPEYVSIDKASSYSYDRDIITDKLINQNSKLPELTSYSIPMYNGTLLQDKCDVNQWGGDGYYDEDEIHALSDAGVNFLSVWYDFAILGYPDYKEGQINLNELKELDQMIAWCMKYGIHVCIECTGLPNRSGLPRGQADYNKDDAWQNELYTNDSLREKVTKYWGILASRYANIPSKYLSFDLMIEASAKTEEIFVNTFKPMVDTIRKYNPYRVIFCYGNYPNGGYEGMAALGCPIAWSFYLPGLISNTEVNDESFPGCKLAWPTYYLPSFMSTGEGDDTLNIKLNKDIKSMTIYIKSWQYTKFQINTDSDTILEENLTQDDKWHKYTLNIALGTKNLSLKVLEGWMNFSSITLVDVNGKQINISPHDNWNFNGIQMPVITLESDSSISSSIPLDFNALYNSQLKDCYDIANKYNVGVMIMEWGVWNQQYLRDPQDSLRYMQWLKKEFDTNHIPSTYLHGVYSSNCASLVESKQNLSPDFTKYSQRYKALSYSSKYYINTWLSDWLYGN